MRFFFFCVLLLTVSCKTTYRTIPLHAIDSSEKQKVYNFGKRILETCKTRQFIQQSEKEATPYLASLSLEEMQYACDVVDKRNGKFIDMKLMEVIDDTFMHGVKIYRHKANFERNDYLVEVRIWLRTDGKFEGIIWQEWHDAYVPYSAKKKNNSSNE